MKYQSSLQRRIKKLERAVGASSIEECRALVLFGLEHGILPKTIDVEKAAQAVLDQGFSMKKLCREIDGLSRNKLPCELVDEGDA